MCGSSDGDGQLKNDSGSSINSVRSGVIWRPLMLMSRPGLGLWAVNRGLMRLVVCLGTVVTHLKNGLRLEQLKDVQVS